MVDDGQGSSVVNDDCDELKHINGDQVALLIIGYVEFGALNDPFWPGEMPPELKTSTKTTPAVQAAVTGCCCKCSAFDEMVDG